MAIVHQLDKRSGITYVYESTSYWDKEKKQSRSHRRLIGRLDPETGEVLPTDGRRKSTEGGEKAASDKPKKTGTRKKRSKTEQVEKPVEQDTVTESAGAEAEKVAEPEVTAEVQNEQVTEAEATAEVQNEQAADQGVTAEVQAEQVSEPEAAEPNEVVPEDDAPKVPSVMVLLDQLDRSVGLQDTLNASTEDAVLAEKLRRMVMYLTVEPKGEVARIRDWEASHFTENAGDEVGTVTSEIVRNYFWMNNEERQESAYWFYNFSYMSSCRTALTYIQNGMPGKTQAVRYRDGRDLGRNGCRNLAMLIGEDTGMTAAYAEVSEKTPYFEGEKLVEKQLAGSDSKPVRMFMPGELYNKENVDVLVKNQVDFLMEIPLTSDLAREYGRKALMEDWFAGDEPDTAAKDEICVKISWKTESKNTFRREIQPEVRELYLHLYRRGEGIERMYLSNVVEDPVLAMRIDGFGCQMKDALLNARDRLTVPGDAAAEECVIFPAVLAGGIRNLLGVQLAMIEEQDDEEGRYAKVRAEEVQHRLDGYDRDYR